ncbi:hypothetical protein [Arthrobacter sp. NA-172]|uniref:hypothetical protein n=1 Tax=Arthrobacter sp. NA-172 TaxID=3367524 RepID=UPI003753FBE1
MMLNEAVARIRAGHLMVRDAQEWDELSTSLARGYDSQDDELIAQLQSPFLQSWRTVIHYVLRDTFEAAKITIAVPTHPWGIAALSTTETTCEPLLCDAEGTIAGWADAPAYGGLRLLAFEEVMSNYTSCLSQLMPDEGRSS